MNADMPQFSTSDYTYVPGNIYCTKCGTQPERSMDHASSSSSNAAIQSTPVRDIALDPPGQYHPPSESAPKQSSLRGVGGWLLFFCVMCTIVAPAREITHIRGSNGTFLNLFALLYAGLQGFVGLSVWLVAKKALQYLKILFFVRTCLAISFILLSLVPLSNSEVPGDSESLLIAGFGTIVNSAIWWSYFRKSRRVRQTFGTNL